MSLKRISERGMLEKGVSFMVTQVMNQYVTDFRHYICKVVSVITPFQI
uniref:Uncharacterized protein n=1 Tax=Anguilla anguilla TaxID=7936 RepID=A0A0E9Q9S3_ANGAN